MKTLDVQYSVYPRMKTLDVQYIVYPRMKHWTHLCQNVRKNETSVSLRNDK